MAGKLVLTYADYGGELSSFQVPILDFSAANYDANTTLIDTLITKIDALTDGLQVKQTRSHLQSGAGAGQSAIPTAQRESKWLISFSDDVTGKVYQREIPCPVLSATTLLQDIGGNANITDTVWTDFISAFEAIVLSEVGNAVSVIGARHVGRNN